MHRRLPIGPPKMHRRFHIGPPNMHRRFRISPPQVSLNLLAPEFHRQGILLTIDTMKEKKHKKKHFEIECAL